MNTGKIQTAVSEAIAEGTAAVIENAAAQVAAAQETAQQIVEAAQAAPLAQAVAETQADIEEIEEWEAGIERQLAEIGNRLTSLAQQLEAILNAPKSEVTVTLPQTEPSSIPLPSPEAVKVETQEAVVTVKPEETPRAAEAAPAIPPRKRTRLI